MYYINNYCFYGINPVKIYDCPCYDRKSFYGKAKIIEDEQGEIFLQSYDTIVCYINKNKKFVRLWNGYSSTTMRHINSFLRFVGISGGGKSWWNNQPIEKH